ncbi:MAG: acyloxyacyl hydrolase [Flavobacteriales bacterium]
MNYLKKELILLFFLLLNIGLKAQTKNHTSFQADYFYGNLVKHNPDVAHLVKGHPSGIILSWNKETTGKNEWEERFNYPDFGISFIYQDFKNDVLGEDYGLYGHYNFYLGDRTKNKNDFSLRLGVGLAYNTNPYHKTENSKNTAFGSHISASIYAMANYKRKITQNISAQTGLTFIHYSNGNTKAPNNGINLLGINVGLNYDLNPAKKEYQKHEKTIFKEPIKYNIVIRSGMNEADVINSGLYPFLTTSLYADKRLSHLSAIQLGTDIFVSKFLKEYVKYKNSVDGENNDPNKYVRVGIMAGHELFINKLSILTQVGVYVYDPVNFESIIYERIGLKRYFGKTVFGTVSLKAHGARAEAVEFGIGARL